MTKRSNWRNKRWRFRFERCCLQSTGNPLKWAMKNLTRRKKVVNKYLFYNVEDGDEMNEMYDNDMVYTYYYD